MGITSEGVIVPVVLGRIPTFLRCGGIRFELIADGLPAAPKRLAAVFILGDHRKDALAVIERRERKGLERKQ